MQMKEKKQKVSAKELKAKHTNITAAKLQDEETLILKWIFKTNIGLTFWVKVMKSITFNCNFSQLFHFRFKCLD